MRLQVVVTLTVGVVLAVVLHYRLYEVIESIVLRVERFAQNLPTGWVVGAVEALEGIFLGCSYCK
jgi:hypothetical protein